MCANIKIGLKSDYLWVVDHGKDSDFKVRMIPAREFKNAIKKCLADLGNNKSLIGRVGDGIASIVPCFKPCVRISRTRLSCSVAPFQGAISVALDKKFHCAFTVHSGN